MEPNNARIRIAAVVNEVCQGNLEHAIEHAQLAFHQDAESQVRLFQLFGENGALFMLETFNPSGSELDLLAAQYDAAGYAEEATFVRRQRMEELAVLVSKRNERERVPDLLRLVEISTSVGDLRAASEYARDALHIAPQEYRVRLANAKAEWNSGNASDAEPHLRWCLLRFPSDVELNRMLRELR